MTRKAVPRWTVYDKRTKQYFVTRRGKRFKLLGVVDTLEEAAALVRSDREACIPAPNKKNTSKTLQFPIPTAADLMDRPSDSAVAHSWNNTKAPRS